MLWVLRCAACFCDFGTDFFICHSIVTERSRDPGGWRYPDRPADLMSSLKRITIDTLINTQRFLAQSLLSLSCYLFIFV
jgi:hypothetical protein